MIIINYYVEIKEQLIKNEVYKRVKDYSKNKSDLETYYNVGKLLANAGKHYGEGIIKEYSIKLSNDINKRYNERTLRKIRQFYILFEKGKWSTLSTKLNWSHYTELLSISDINKINYYINLCVSNNLSVRELRNKIKLNEYERLDEKTKIRLVKKKENRIEDFIKNPIMIKSDIKENISEKVLHKLILEDISSFMKELGEGYSFVDDEYKIKIGDRYNYIDILLYNINYNCYVVIELKVTEIKAEYIGQIKKYMNYIDINLRNINQDKTIGIIICKKDNKFIMEYCSDERVFKTTYQFVE